MQISITVSVFCCFLPPSESYPTIYLWKAMCPCTWLNRLGGHSLPWPPSRMYDTMWHSMGFLCVDFHSEKWYPNYHIRLWIGSICEIIHSNDAILKAKCQHKKHKKSKNRQHRFVASCFFNQPNDSISRIKGSKMSIQVIQCEVVWCLHGQAHSLSSSLTASFVISAYDKYIQRKED